MYKVERTFFKKKKQKTRSIAADWLVGRKTGGHLYSFLCVFFSILLTYIYSPDDDPGLLIQ